MRFDSTFDQFEIGETKEEFGPGCLPADYLPRGQNDTGAYQIYRSSKINSTKLYFVNSHKIYTLQVLALYELPPKDKITLEKVINHK